MRLLALFLSAFLLVGCAGYTVGPIKPTPMKNVSTLAVKTVKNDTLEPRVSALLANALIKQIQADGTYRVTDSGQADAVLEVTLNAIDRRPARSLRGNVLQTREYLLNLRARYRVLNPRTGVVLDQRSASGSTSFFVANPNLLTADSNSDERQALPLAAEDLAMRITSLISEGW
jgi:outer membrane lipopolysaccharide assembly protein LptE/RlpB